MDAVARDFAERWQHALRLPELAAESTVELTAAALRPRIEAAFPVLPPRWSAATLHSPDLQLCAESPDALARGEFLAVLGELHAAWPTFDCAVFTERHPDPERLRDRLAADPGRRVGLPGYPYQREYHWVAPETAPQPAPADDVAGPRPVEQWAEVPVWQQVPAPPAGPAPERAWVFAAEETGASVASGLRAAGTEVAEVLPGDIDYGALVAGGVPDRIVHAWALAGDPAGTDAAAAAGAQERGFFSLLALTQALAAGAPDAAVRIDVLTAGTEDVTGTDLVRPEHAIVAGIARVVPLENPHLAVRHVDLDPRGTPAPDVVRELLHPAADEPSVALRGRRRWQRVAAPVDLPAADTVLRESGRYLVTGGLGGIGLTLAECSARR